MKNLFNKGQLVEIISTGEERKVVSFGLNDKCAKGIIFYQLEGVDVFYPETALAKAKTRKEIKAYARELELELEALREKAIEVAEDNAILKVGGKMMNIALGKSIEDLKAKDEKIESLTHLVKGYKGLAGEL